MIMPHMHWSQLELRARAESSKLKVELEAGAGLELNGPEPTVEPAELGLEAKARTADVYARPGWALSEVRGLRPLRHCQS